MLLDVVELGVMIDLQASPPFLIFSSNFSFQELFLLSSDSLIVMGSLGSAVQHNLCSGLGVLAHHHNGQSC